MSYSHTTSQDELITLDYQVHSQSLLSAGTITQSIIIGEALSVFRGMLAIIAVMVINFLIVATFMTVRDRLPNRHNVAFDKNAEIFLRINGFLVGAYGVDLIVIGIRNLVNA